jgi:hypothetical protein
VPGARLFRSHALHSPRGRFFFAGCTSDSSCGLWSTDGSPEETGAVPGLASLRGRPSQLTTVGGRVFFNAFNDL